MTDQDKLEKVIKALELCTSKIETRTQVPCETCPYYNREYHGVLGDGCCNALSLKSDVLFLLKAQEPREPHYTELKYIVNGMPVAIKHPECPRCYDNGLVLWDAEIEKGAAYCKRCGQAVKWE